MGVKAVAALAAALVVGATPPAAERGARYLLARQAPEGGFAEVGSAVAPTTTAWVVIALRAAGTPPSRLEQAREYLRRSEGELADATDVELALVAQAALGDPPQTLLARVRAQQRPDGRIGPTVNSTIWGILALRAAGEPAPAAALRYLRAQQRPSGGWSWHARGAPDSNDTAAAIQALRAAGISGRPIRRGVAFLRRLQNRDGGFELTAGRGSDTQSTAWAVQALLSAGAPPGKAAYRYLARMRRPDGSFRYSARYVTTPVWVTAHAVTALAGKPLPLR